MSHLAHAMKAKYLLAQMALQDPDRFYHTFGDSDDQTYLINLWRALGQEFASDEQIPAVGLRSYSPHSSDDVKIALICFPLPRNRNEAYYLALLISDGHPRVFCLEDSVNPVAKQKTTVVSELARNGRANWGAGCEPDAELFVERIRSIVCDADANPVSFIPMQFA